MVTVIARWTVDSKNANKVFELAQELVAKSQQEPGNLAYDLYVKKDSPNEVLIFENYKTMEDFEFHKTTEHFQKIAVEQIIPLVESRELLVFE